MNPANDDPARRPFSKRKVRDRAFILLMVGLVFLVPPIADVFQLDMRVAEIPFTAVYLFVVWGFLIIGAALLSRKMYDDEEPVDPLKPSQNNSD